MKIKNISHDDARDVLERLEEHFNLVYSSKTCAIGNTVTVNITYLKEDKAEVEINSDYFVDSSLLEPISEYDDSYFLD